MSSYGTGFGKLWLCILVMPPMQKSFKLFLAPSRRIKLPTTKKNKDFNNNFNKKQKPIKLPFFSIFRVNFLFKYSQIIYQNVDLNKLILNILKLVDIGLIKTKNRSKIGQIMKMTITDQRMKILKNGFQI